jgi:hypothetical protein
MGDSHNGNFKGKDTPLLEPGLGPAPVGSGGFRQVFWEPRSSPGRGPLASLRYCPVPRQTSKGNALLPLPHGSLSKSPTKLGAEKYHL